MEEQSQQPQNNQKLPSVHVEETKLTVLLVTTVFLGIMSLTTFLVAQKFKNMPKVSVNKETQETTQTPQLVEENEIDTESTQETVEIIETEKTINPENELRIISQLDLEATETFFNNITIN